MEKVLPTKASFVRVAKKSDRVFRDECVLSFDSALSPKGIYTNLTTFVSFGADFVAIDRQFHPDALYLHQQHTKTYRKQEENTTKQPTKLAIGGPDGFAINDGERFEITKSHSLAWFDASKRELVEIPLTAEGIPSRILESVESILSHAGNIVEENVSMWQEELKETKYAEKLEQLPAAPKVSSNPSAWKCQAEKCDKQENLWLNLSDGFIGCGRSNWDGSGGCGAALQHYQDTGKRFPLAVKLGTITAEGGDVFSYAADEDDLVTNKNLAKHLQHFGINMNNLKKTDKSMNELQVGLNMSYEFDKITESGSKLVSISGPGLMGFKNLGNSCYMNSVLQLLLALPEVQRRYSDAADSIFKIETTTAVDDFACQMAKLARGVLSDRYKLDLESKDAELRMIELRPSTFRALVGKGHPDFSTGQQQDAVEYIQYLIDFMTRAERTAHARIGSLFSTVQQSQDDVLREAAEAPTANLFKFAFEDRVQCLESKKVKYVTREDSFLQLQIPVELACNAAEVKEAEQKRQRLNDDAKTASKTESAAHVVPVVPFGVCLEKTLEPEVIDGFLSSATGKKGLATRSVRFKTFPRYLLMQMRRFYVSDDWTPKKLDVSVRVPESFSLTPFKSNGMQAEEDALPDADQGVQSAGAAGHASGSVQPDEVLVAQLTSMGFSENGSKRAAIATQNASAEVAMEWILSHMEDADFNDPVVESTAGGGDQFDIQHVSALSAMGFSDDQAKCALANAGNNPDRAAEWLFSHMETLETLMAQWKTQTASGSTTGTSSADAATSRNRLDAESPGDYELIGFVSHIGKNSNSGHYVCHMKKQNRWIIFNDDKVALSEKPPLDAGYLYLFRRKDVEM